MPRLPGRAEVSPHLESVSRCELAPESPLRPDAPRFSAKAVLVRASAVHRAFAAYCLFRYSESRRPSAGPFALEDPQLLFESPQFWPRMRQVRLCSLVAAIRRN